MKRARAGSPFLARATLAGCLSLFAKCAAGDPHVTCGDFQVGAAVVVYGQRVAADGSVDPNWVPDAARLRVGAGHEYAYAIPPDGQTPVVVSRTELARDGSDIRAQRLEAGGGVSASWLAAGAAVCAPSLDQYGPRATTDGSGGAIIAWQDFRKQSSSRLSATRQRHGAIASGWPADGLSLGAAGVDQVAPAVMSDSSGGARVAWQEFSPAIVQDSESVHADQAGRSLCVRS